MFGHLVLNDLVRESAVVELPFQVDKSFVVADVLVVIGQVCRYRCKPFVESNRSLWLLSFTLWISVVLTIISVSSMVAVFLAMRILPVSRISMVSVHDSAGVAEATKARKRK